MKHHWIEHISMVLLILGAILWGVFGLTALFGTGFILTGWFWDIVYILVGLSGIGGLVALVKMWL